MTVKDGIKEMLRTRQMSAVRVAKKAGRTKSFIFKVFERESCRIGTLVTIADILDYDVVLRPRGQGKPIIIDEVIERNEKE